MTTHELKINECYFNHILEGKKTCEIRFNDRDYQVGDIIRFKYLWKYEERPSEAQFDGDCYLSDVNFIITHVLHFPEGLKEGFVALSIKKL